MAKRRYEEKTEKDKVREIEEKSWCKRNRKMTDRNSKRKPRKPRKR